MFVQVQPERVSTALKLGIALNACVAVIGGPVAFTFNAVLFSKNGVSLLQALNFGVAVEQPLITLVVVGTCVALAARMRILVNGAAPINMWT